MKYVRPGGGFVPSFPLFQKTNVNGLLGVHPVFNYLKVRQLRLSPTRLVSPAGFTPCAALPCILQNSCPPVSNVVSAVSWIPWLPIQTTDIQWNFEVCGSCAGFALVRPPPV